MIPGRRAAPRLTGFLLACAVGWTLAQASLLVVANGLLASYDFPGHLHLSAVQMRSPASLWDDSWYAGYPTYAYPPLAHRLAGELMRRLGIVPGFKAAVVLAYLAAVPAVYAAARTVAGLPPVAAAASTLLVSISPSLFRAFLFGQYPSLLAYAIFLGALAALFSCLDSPQPSRMRMLLAALLVALLGSTHLYTLLLLLVVLAPLVLVVNVRALLSRIAAPLAGGTIMAVVPSLLWLADMPLLSKTPVPHITRSIDMIHPAGLLNWVLHPAGLPMVIAALVLIPAFFGGRNWQRVGLVASGALIFYLRGELGVIWATVAAAVALAAGLGFGARGGKADRQITYLTLAGLISLWLALGPAGGLARLLPFSDVLVYDRPLLYGAPLAWLALTRVLWSSGSMVPWRRVGPVLLIASGGLLLGMSVVTVMRTYAVLAPGAERAIPRGLPLRPDYADFLARHRQSGRVLPLGFPYIVYTLPDVVGAPLIDGAYNDARVLAPLRSSGLEALGNEKFTNRDLRMTRFFLANADRYGIDWVMTADRYYDPAVPLERFLLAYESPGDVYRGVRIYRALTPSGHAWVGDPGYRSSDIEQVSLRDRPWGTGGGTSSVALSGSPGATELVFSSALEAGWAFTEVPLPAARSRCNRLAFDAWSPTGASLTVRAYHGGRSSVIYPETPLGPNRSSLRLAVDCPRVDRLAIAISGVGVQRASLTPLLLQKVEDATKWVPFERAGSECFRTTLPQAGAATVSVPSYPRWRTVGGDDSVSTGSDARGLLTLTGSPGRHTLCLSFPAGLRLARTYLPIIYLLAAVVAGILVGGPGTTRRWQQASGIVLLRGLLTAIREVILHRRLTPEQAWDLRARTAPDWYATFTPGASPDEAAVPDLTEILDGLDRAWLQRSHVLEVGCGPGRLLAHMAPLVSAAWGVDISGEMITLARDRLRPWPNVTVAKNDGRTLAAFPDGAFDYVYSVNVVQHIPDRGWIESYMGEIHRVLRAGGLATIQVDGRGESRGWRLIKAVVGADSWAGTLLTRQELIDLARRYGFVVVRCAFSEGAGIRWKRQGLWLRVRRP